MQEVYFQGVRNVEVTIYGHFLHSELANFEPQKVTHVTLLMWTVARNYYEVITGANRTF